MLPFTHIETPTNAARLLKKYWSGDAEFAAREMENYLAQCLSFSHGSPDDVQKIATKYHCPFDETWGCRLDMFTAFVWFTLDDGKLTPTEISEARHLATVLAIPMTDAQEIINTAIAKKVARLRPRRKIVALAPSPPSSIEVEAMAPINEQDDIDQACMDECEIDGFRLGGGTIKQKRYAARIVVDLVINGPLGEKNSTCPDDPWDNLWQHLQQRSAKWWIETGQNTDLEEYAEEWLVKHKIGEGDHHE